MFKRYGVVSFDEVNSAAEDSPYWVEWFDTREEASECAAKLFNTYISVGLPKGFRTVSRGQEVRWSDDNDEIAIYIIDVESGSKIAFSH